MSLPEQPRESTPAGAARFATTHWTVVCSAGAHDSLHARAALEKLCATYWYPVYAFVRRQGHSSHDAQDLTQEFFARLLENNTFAVADRRRGRFRSFLLASLKNFLVKEWQRANAQKRGGGEVFVPLETGEAERRYALEPADTLTAETIFERRWALTLLEQVLSTLRNEHIASGKGDQFDALKPALMGERHGAPYASVAAQFGTTEGAIKITVHRMRQRYRELLHETIAQTVATPTEIEDELRHLFAVVSH
jgi:RNA polymerase sigma-70 factor (ECF subfamily)